MERVRQNPFDLLLLDLNMLGISSTDTIIRVKAQRADLPILVLSMHNEPQVAASMLKAGASGYITKDCEPDILLSAIRKVAARGKYIAPEIEEKMVFDVTSSKPDLSHSHLPDREQEVFRLMVLGRCVNEIAAQLVISNKTVSTHKARLMEKMQLSSRADLMRLAMQHDLLGQISI
jgi:DNA-binding NarL/FixJ family response regulator